MALPPDFEELLDVELVEAVAVASVEPLAAAELPPPKSVGVCVAVAADALPVAASTWPHCEACGNRTSATTVSTQLGQALPTV